ncbi:MAG: LLM class flavin-dependent oxidoreductase, partial [Alphaproteobacteria bacterium]
EKVMPQFKDAVEEREAKKAKELAPFIEAALARKPMMEAPSKADTPVVKAAVKASKPAHAKSA